MIQAGWKYYQSCFDLSLKSRFKYYFTTKYGAMEKMTAVIFRNYGPPEVLEVKEVDKPLPNKDELLVRVYASTLNSGDVRIRKADPFMVRFMLGLVKPKRQVPGIILAGVVETVGEGVTRFKPGDRIYGMSMKNFGAHAGFVCLPEESTLAHIPASVSYNEASAIPFGFNSALHFLKKAGAGKGKHVLIYGASGAVGTAAIQLAKFFGSEVTAICSTANLGMVKALGADHIIDYTNTDFSNSGIYYDIIFDAVGKSPFDKCIRSLKKDGYYLRIVHMSFAPILKSILVPIFTKKKIIGGVATDSSENLAFLNRVIEEGSLKPVIDRIYTMEEIVEAHRYVEAGHKKGNVVITMSHS